MTVAHANTTTATWKRWSDIWSDGNVRPDVEQRYREWHWRRLCARAVEGAIPGRPPWRRQWNHADRDVRRQRLPYEDRRPGHRVRRHRLDRADEAAAHGRHGTLCGGHDPTGV